MKETADPSASLGMTKGKVALSPESGWWMKETADPSASLGVTKGKAALFLNVVGGWGEQQVPPLRSPGFPVDLDGVDAFHVPFFTEGRIRGLVQWCVAGNPGTLRSG
jgi:hypothetical protein